MQLTSSAFTDTGMIPAKYTCDNIDVSPTLIFSDVPDGAKSLALICDDPDAPMGTWVHWVIFNIDPGLTELPEGIKHDVSPRIGADSSSTAIQGINDFKRFGYGGPCPTPGPAHRYFFKLYALDTLIELEKKVIDKGVTADLLMGNMEGHILAETQLMGKYKR